MRLKAYYEADGEERMTKGYLARLIGASLLASVSAPALAQSVGTPAPSGKPVGNDQAELADIVVTGTSLRKVAPAGAQTITVTPVQIAATGATSTDQLLANIPQLGSFGTTPSVNIGGIQQTVNPTNIRNLPQGFGGGSPTLVLLDGHRMVGAGVNQAYPDPDVIPPALIERVEVVTDGGSAVYGADAIGGVVNFITKDEFNGIEIGGRQGFGDNFRKTDINVTAGKSWDSGSFFVGYNYSGHNGIYGFDRDYVRTINYATGLPGSLNCSPANVTTGSGATLATYAVVNGNSLQLSNANRCDQSRSAQFYPREVRNSVMAGFRQELGDRVTFELKGYFSQRKNRQDQGPLTGSGSVRSTNPNYISTGGGNTATQTVSFNYGPVGGDALVTTSLRSWGVTPTITWKIGQDWQVRAYYNYGESQTVASYPQQNSTILAADIAAGSINPYNIAASSPAAIAQVLNYDLYGIGKDKLSNAKAVFDGPLFSLPGGQVRVAIGGEISHENYRGVTGTNTYQNVAILPLSSSNRDVKSGFAELNVPLLSPDNNFPLIYSATLAAAVRYDHYSDFGGNWAPNVGMTVKPVSWIGLRARWNKAFQAPSLATIAQATSPVVNTFSNVFVQFDPFVLNPNFPNNGGAIVYTTGTVSPLKPQRARDYNLGFDISPPVLPGLSVHFTYWNIHYTNQISPPPFGISNTFFSVPAFQSLVLANPTIAQLTSFLQGTGASAASIAQSVATVNALGGKVYEVADARSRNLGITKAQGFDIGADYRRATSFGSIYANFNSSLTTKVVNAADGANFGRNQAGVDVTDFNSTTSIGATVGQTFRAQVTWNHIAGFDLSAAAGLGQTKVSSFDTFDIFAQYELKQGSLPPITFSLGVNNLFNTNPPIYNGSVQNTTSVLHTGYAYSTLGRVVQIGASVKF
jgi:iron complex outermembrane receptor protein